MCHTGDTRDLSYKVVITEAMLEPGAHPLFAEIIDYMTEHVTLGNNVLHQLPALMRMNAQILIRKAKTSPALSSRSNSASVKKRSASRIPVNNSFKLQTTAARVFFSWLERSCRVFRQANGTRARNCWL